MNDKGFPVCSALPYDLRDSPLQSINADSHDIEVLSELQVIGILLVLPRAPALTLNSACSAGLMAMVMRV